VKPFENPHAQEPARHPLEPLILPFRFPRKEHEAHEHRPQSAQCFQGGVEREIDPRVTWPQEVCDQTAQPGGGDDTERKEKSSHDTTRDRIGEDITTRGNQRQAGRTRRELGTRLARLRSVT
jgi:hypothetical protein